MKRVSFFLIAAFILSISTFGQSIYIGKIFQQEAPHFPAGLPSFPCPNFRLETASGNYILSVNSQWICGEPLIVDGIVYEMDDEVEITGTVRSSGIDMYLVEHFTLEIETIKKIKLSDINSQAKSDNKVCFDAANQRIVIDETLKDQGLTFELTDIQGRIVFRKTNVDNGFISVTDLQSGVYLYRLLQGHQTAYSGKIVKQ